MSDRSTGYRSTGQLFKEVTEDLSTLVRKEVELAKIELMDSVTAKAKGAAIIGVVGVMGIFVLFFALMAVRDAVNMAVPNWASAWSGDLAVVLLLAVVSTVGGLIAKRKLSTPIKADLTKETIKDDVEWAKSVAKR